MHEDTAEPAAKKRTRKASLDEAMALIRRAEGATLAEIAKALKITAGSARNVVSDCRVKAGHKVAMTKVDDKRTAYKVS